MPGFPKPSQASSICSAPIIASANYNLKELLKQTGEGLAIMKEYEMNKILREEERLELAAIIINYELRDDLDRRISASRFIVLAEAVLKTFPAEAENTWIVINKHGKSVTGEGKL